MQTVGIGISLSYCSDLEHSCDRVGQCNLGPGRDCQRYLIPVVLVADANNDYDY